MPDEVETQQLLPRDEAMVRGFSSINPERLAAIFAIMAIIVVISASWFGQQIALIDSSCSAAQDCASLFGR